MLLILQFILPTLLTFIHLWLSKRFLILYYPLLVLFILYPLDIVTCVYISGIFFIRLILYYQTELPFFNKKLNKFLNSNNNLKEYYWNRHIVFKLFFILEFILSFCIHYFFLYILHFIFIFKIYFFLGIKVDLIFMPFIGEQIIPLEVLNTYNKVNYSFFHYSVDYLTLISIFIPILLLILRVFFICVGVHFILLSGINFIFSLTDLKNPLNWEQALFMSKSFFYLCAGPSVIYSSYKFGQLMNSGIKASESIQQVNASIRSLTDTAEKEDLIKK